MAVVLWQIVQSNVIQLVNLGLVSVLKLVHGSKLIMLAAFKMTVGQNAATLNSLGIRQGCSTLTMRKLN